MNRKTHRCLPAEHGGGPESRAFPPRHPCSHLGLGLVSLFPSLAWGFPGLGVWEE